DRPRLAGRPAPPAAAGPGGRLLRLPRAGRGRPGGVGPDLRRAGGGRGASAPGGRGRGRRRPGRRGRGSRPPGRGAAPPPRAGWGPLLVPAAPRRGEGSSGPGGGRGPGVGPPGPEGPPFHGGRGNSLGGRAGGFTPAAQPGGITPPAPPRGNSHNSTGPARTG